LVVSAVLLLGCTAIACGDPVHDEAVAALGGETPGIPAGPLHRPGQPCVTCHGGMGPAESEFSIAGTVYLLSREDRPAVGAAIEIQDVTGTIFRGPANEAGNFYISSDDWTPNYPLRAKATFGNTTKQMLTHISLHGSCADCHYNPPGQNSPGHIFLATNASDLAGSAAP
jgi:hypothetical protein